MKIGRYELRKPWVKYVDFDLGKEVYDAVRKSIGEDIAKEIESEIENMMPPVDEVELAVYEAAHHYAAIARGK
jgi:hypothetical protein